MTITIDVSETPKVKLKLKLKDKIFTHFFEAERDLSERLVPEIKKFLKKRKIKFTDLEKIEVNPGPGHFSRIRTAVATANAIAFGLGLPQKIVHPAYDKDPNITWSKKKNI